MPVIAGHGFRISVGEYLDLVAFGEHFQVVLNVFLFLKPITVSEHLKSFKNKAKEYSVTTCYVQTSYYWSCLVFSKEITGLIHYSVMFSLIILNIFDRLVYELN